ncbi:MAG: MG2 domain-containing protein, partial [Prosthecobacter sp.]
MKPSLSLALLPVVMLVFWTFKTSVSVATDQSTSLALKKKPAKTLKAAIHVHPAELTPVSTIEVVFPTPMISKEKIGTVEAVSPVMSVPELRGTFEWVSTRSGYFHLTQSPKFATSYDFKLCNGVADLAGQLLSTDTLDSVESARFQILDRYPRWYDEDAQNRQPKFLFEFNDHVNSAAAAKHIKFVSETMPGGLVAKVRHATGKDFVQRNTEPQPTWAEQISKVKPSLTNEAVRLSAVVVEPAQLLPVGKWRLDIAQALSNASGQNQLAKGDSVELGEIRSFAVRSISAHTPFDAPYYLNIHTNKRLLPLSEVPWKEEQIAEFAQKMAALISIEPSPVGPLKPTLDGRTLTLTGGFKANQKYKVKISSTLTSGDGMPLSAEFLGEETFVPNSPYVAAPTFIQGQMAKGEATYDFSVANVSQVRVRAKKLTGQDLLKALEMYRPYRMAFYGEDKQKKAYKTTSIDQYPGKLILDRLFPINKPLDHSEILKLSWREILADQPAGPIFIELEGTAVAGLKEKSVVTQTILQFTDMGLMQKSNGKESLVYVTSLETGKAISGVHLTMVERDSKKIAQGKTDTHGIARVPGAVPTWVLAEKNGDCAVIECQESDANVRVPWHINQAYNNVWQPQRRTFVFSDRPLYKPGDTAHFKAHTRLLVGDDLSLDPAPVKGHLTIFDPRYRAVVDREIQFKANGTWAEDIVLPTGPTGWYQLNITSPNTSENSEESVGGGMSFRVDDYKPNTFEVKLDTKSIQWAKDRIRVPLKANYYMGKPLSVAKIQWSAYTIRQYQPPPLFKHYSFGDAPSWAHYAEDRDADGAYIIRDNFVERDGFVNGDLLIDEDGTATLEMPMPLPDRAALPQVVHMSAEVTDVNEQTISAFENFEVPGAQFMIGLKGPESFATAGKVVNLEVIGIDPKGEAPGVPVKVDVKVERQQYHTLKIATAGGGTTTKDQVVLLEEYKQSHELKPATTGSTVSATIPFTPAHGGIYFVTAESLDPQGMKVLSRMPFYAVGGREFPWAMEDGSRMNLQPEKTDYKPGEEAVIVVKTPIAGTA